MELFELGVGIHGVVRTWSVNSWRCSNLECEFMELNLEWEFMELAVVCARFHF